MGSQGFSREPDIFKQAKAARRKALDEGVTADFAWYKSAKAEMDAQNLEGDELAAAKYELLKEFARRGKRSASRAKRQNTPEKAFMRQVQKEVDDEKTNPPS